MDFNESLKGLKMLKNLCILVDYKGFFKHNRYFGLTWKHNYY